MATYLVSYDLVKPGKNYDDLITALKTYPNWWHHLGSTWCIVSPNTAAQIRDHLSQHIDQNDRLLVVRSAGEGAWQGFNPDGSKWLKDNL